MVMTRHAFLAELHLALQPQGYLEIGVQFGYSLSLATCPAIGIDPYPRVVASGQQAIYAMTSDDYFAQPGLTLPQIDLAFIDGMHLFEYALRDFINVQRFANDNTVVIFDDVLPYNPDIAGRTPLPGDWTGDVWKICPILTHYDFDATLVDVSPTGVLVVSNVNHTEIDYHEMLATYVAEDTVPLWAIDRSLAVDPGVFLEKMRSQ
jgi:hypothetical protein